MKIIFQKFFKGKRPHQGSLLLEALLSVVILSVSITLIIQSMVASLRASVYSTGYTMALNLLENKMYTLIQQGAQEEGFTEEDFLGDEEDHYTYVLSTESADQIGSENINKLKLKAIWQKGRKNNAIALETYLFKSIE